VPVAIHSNSITGGEYAQSRGLPLSEAVRFGWRPFSSIPVIILTIAVAVVVPMVIDWGGEHAFHRRGQQFLMTLIDIVVAGDFALGCSKSISVFATARNPSSRTSSTASRAATSTWPP
jgi:hypothetical protein